MLKYTTREPLENAPSQLFYTKATVLYKCLCRSVAQVLPYTGNQDERAQIRDEIMDENALENYNILISTYSQVGGGVGFADTQPV